MIKELLTAVLKCKWLYLRRKALFYSPVQVHIDHTSELNVSKLLRFNCNHSIARVIKNILPGSLCITDGSRMDVDNFIFRSGCNVSVNGGGIFQ